VVYFLMPVVTIGMTVGTSNCTKHKIVTKEKESLHFATNNYFELQGDVARGRGEYLAAFAATMGCPAGAQSRLNDHLRRNYDDLFGKGDVNPEALMIEVFKTIFRDESLTAQCSLGVG
jgi:hypothetical protein